MKERTFVKLRVDMYDGTKFKVIDTLRDRDLIHYVWTRLVTLAGKVNLEGDLYMSKSIPYTIETLAIEFNRDYEEIKLALNAFVELEMIEVTQGDVYRVKNFAKHQNIKVKEKIEAKDEKVKEKEIVIEETLKNENKESKNEITQNEVEVVKFEDRGNLKRDSSSIKKIDDRNNEKTNNTLKDNIPILYENKRSKRMNKKKEKEKIFSITDAEEVEDIVCFCDGERPLGEGESVIASWILGFFKGRLLFILIY